VITGRLAPLHDLLDDELSVEVDDDAGHHPREDADDQRAGELAHAHPAAGELDQRDHRERQLQAEDHLAQHEQAGRASSPVRAMTITAGTIASERVISRRSHGRMRKCRKPSIVICPASVPVMRAALPGADQRDREGGRRQLRAEQPFEQLVRLADLRRR
jgi:hypothetical protein